MHVQRLDPSSGKGADLKKIRKGLKKLAVVSSSSKRGSSREKKAPRGEGQKGRKLAEEPCILHSKPMEQVKNHQNDFSYSA